MQDPYESDLDAILDEFSSELRESEFEEATRFADELEAETENLPIDDLTLVEFSY